MAERRKPIVKAPVKTAPTKIIKSKSPVREVKLTPEYIYTTDQSVETFSSGGFQPPITPKNNLSPASNFQPQTQGSTVPPPPPAPSYTGGENIKFCHQYPDDPRCNDEQNPYETLGLFSEEVKYIFDPSVRSKQNVTKDPVSSLYEQGRDDTQLDVGKVVRTECRCKDGSVVMGYLDTRTGQKDCSPCKKTTFNSPNIYKNYKTNKPKTVFSDKQVPLRKQVGVSHFGDVEMKGCQTGNEKKSLERVNAVSTLNKVINTDTIDSIGGANVTTPANKSGLPFSMYDNDPTNVYGI